MSEKIQLLLSSNDELLSELAKNGLVKGKNGEEIQIIDADSKEGIKLVDKHNIEHTPRAIKEDKFCNISYERERAVISCPKEEQ